MLLKLKVSFHNIISYVRGKYVTIWFSLVPVACHNTTCVQFLGIILWFSKRNFSVSAKLDNVINYLTVI